MTLPEPVFHHVSINSDWPAPVKRIAHLLCRPLPAFVADELQVPVSHLYTKLVEELNLSSSSMTYQDTDIDVYDEPNNPGLSSIVNLILHTVLTLRSIRDNEAHVEDQRRAILAISFFVQRVCGIFHQEFHAMSNRSFLLPRVESMFIHEDPGCYDGLAIFLLCHVIRLFDEQEESNQNDLSTDESSSQSRSEHTPEHDDSQSSDESSGPARSEYTQEDDSQSNDESTSQTSDECMQIDTDDASLDLHLDAHMIREEQGRRLTAALPLLSFASRENSVQLLTSIVYQRHVWEIDQPAIVIELDRMCCSARILLGWFEGDREVQPGTVHIACSATAPVSDPSVGQFDLTNPNSAFALSQLILNLGHHFKDVISGARHPIVSALCWRADHLTSICFCVPDSSCTEDPDDRVARWVVNCQSQYNTGKALHDHCRMTTPLNANPMVPGSDSSSKNPKSTSSSTFSHRRAHGPQDESLTWLHYITTRFNLIVAAEPIEEKQLSDSSKGESFPLLKDILQDVNNKITAEYKRITRQSYPSNWMEGNETNNAFVKLEVDSRFEDARKELWRRLIQLDPQPDRIDDLDDMTVKIISQKLSTLLEIAFSIREMTERASQKLRSYSEADWRPKWDQFFMSFSVTTPENYTAMKIFNERHISLSRNRILDKLKQDGKSHARTWEMAIYKRQWMYCRMLREKGSRFDHFASRAETYYAFARNEDGSKSERLLVSHAKSEPSSAVPDVMGIHFIPAKNVLGSNIKKRDGFLFTKNLAAVKHDAVLEGGIGASDIAIPRIIVEYKKQEIQLDHGTNQLRNQLIAAVEFLAALNIYEFPIYGLVVQGPKARLYMAWKTQRKGQWNPLEPAIDEILSNEEVVYTMEEGVEEYDLGDSLSALQLAFIVSRLMLDSESVRSAFTSAVLEKNETAFDGENFPLWTMESQKKQYVDIFPPRKKGKQKAGEVGAQEVDNPAASGGPGNDNGGFEE